MAKLNLPVELTTTHSEGPWAIKWDISPELISDYNNRHLKSPPENREDMFMSDAYSATADILPHEWAEEISTRLHSLILTYPSKSLENRYDYLDETWHGQNVFPPLPWSFHLITRVDSVRGIPVATLYKFRPDSYTQEPLFKEIPLVEACRWLRSVQRARSAIPVPVIPQEYGEW